MGDLLSDDMPEGFEELLFEYQAYDNGKLRGHDEEAKPLTPEFYNECKDKWGSSKEDWHKVCHYFMTWVWMDWVEKNLPKPPPPSQEEIDAMTEEALTRYQEMARKVNPRQETENV